MIIVVMIIRFFMRQGSHISEPSFKTKFAMNKCEVVFNVLYGAERY